MKSFATVYYWLRFGAVVLVALIAVSSAIRRSRAKAKTRDLLYGVLGVVGLVIAIVVAARHMSWPLVVGLFVLGVAVGYLTAGVRPIAAWLEALVAVFFSIMVLFGAGGAVAFGLAVLGFGVGLPLGLGIRGNVPARSSAAPAA